ncbi:MAG: DUF3857 domain-containing protein [Saprospiraceae bacterium]
MFSVKTPLQPLVRLLCTTLLLFSSVLVFANDYQKAWEALARNDRQTARQLLEKALKNPATAADAALTLLYLETFDGHEDQEKAADLWRTASKSLKDPYPYLFPLWFNSAVIGGYGRKSNDNLKLMKELMADPKCPGTYKTAIQYALGHHYRTKSDFEEMNKAWRASTSIVAWQFVGPFDNLSGSGFEKNYAPIAQPEPSATFKSTYNADIQWFTPKVQESESWITPSFYVRYKTGITFAQSFVTAPSDLDAILAVGFTGNIRVWVNDRLLISEQEYRRTDFDLYKTKCQLKKGMNRVLVQLGYEDEDYPNFCIRFVDAQSNMIPGLASSATYAPYPKDKSTAAATPIPFFAETFFEQKVKNEPENLLNYILLAETYLRSEKSQEGLEVIEKAIAKQPDNSVLRFYRIQALVKTNNRTELTQEFQRMKDADPTALTSLIIRYEEEKDNERYDEAEKILDERVSRYGEDEEVLEERVRLLGEQNKMEDLLKLIDEAHRRYPENTFFNEMVHNVALMLRKDPQAAIAINEQFLKKKYVISVVNQTIRECFEVGENNKAIKMITQLSEIFPASAEYYEQLFDYYYGTKDNKKAKQAIETLLGLAPYHAQYHDNAAKLAEQMGDEKAALRSYQKALHYNPNDFDARRRIRELQSETDLVTLLPQNDVYDLIKKSKGPGKSGEHDWYYILDECATILYPERCSETYYTVVAKVLNEKGIDTWKENSLGFNPWRQRLIVEKAEVVKPNGSKFTAEQNGNEIVFTNLAKGDAVYLRYRIVSYAYGRMAREHWDSYAFNAFIPSEISRYALLAPKDLVFDYKTVNFDLPPKEKTVENYKLYTWETFNELALKRENLMPRRVDIGKNIYVSTIRDWQEIANWYADLSSIQAKQDYEVQQAVQALFPTGQTFTPLQKAQKIYEFVVKNISYSSVSFRQSAYVPQKASKVLQTKLGDCKDLSTLYAAMAREVGLEANLVLFSTRDNGETAMPLPAVEFNHCIVKVNAGGQTYYLELTDPNLPFGSLPNDDLGGLALEIPFNGKGAKPGIYNLYPDNRIRDYRHQTAQIVIKNRDLNVTAQTTVSGIPSRNLRGTYATLNTDKQIEEMQKSIGGKFSNPVTVKNVAFGALDQLRDTLQFHLNYNVRNEVIEVGNLKTFRVPFYYYYLKSDAFQEETRNFPINYWEYEDADEYREDISIEVPEGKQLSEIPKNVALSFGGTSYSLTYEKKSPTSLRVVRHIKVSRANIPVKDYPAFRTFLDEVVAAENRYVAFK